MADPKSPAPPDTSSTDPQARRRRKLSAIMMADVSGFSRMMGKNEDATVDLIKEFHDRVLRLVEQFEGRVVDTAGDSVFGEFDSVVNAVRCACRIQEEQTARNAGQQPDARIETRIGVHLGDVIVEDYRVYGDGVNIAARLEPLADPGGICISEAVYQQIRNKLDLPMEDVGLKQLKNIEHPIRLYKVAPVREAPRDDEPAPPPPAPVAERADLMPTPVGVEFLGASTLILSSTGAFLLLSPILLFSTGGVLATGGAILLSLALGREWARRTRRSGNLLIALGIGLASGAAWTNWSKLTNGLFLLAGVIVAASGLGGQRRKPPKN
ncbi:MAG: hypothetical protein HYR72_20050 [Deltaproteobacteria bacterium]|nr:hypothetical protein [Deltaproteobacteria bacterium]